MSYPGTNWIVIVRETWMDEVGSGTNYRSDGKQFTSRGIAVTHGFETLQRSDDFNLGLITPDGRLAGIYWMDEQIPETWETLRRVEQQLGLS